MIVLFRLGVLVPLLFAATLAGVPALVPAQSIAQDSSEDPTTAPDADSLLDGANRTPGETLPDDESALTPGMSEQQYYEAQLRDLCDMGNMEACDMLYNLFQGGTEQQLNQSYEE
jgi:hypothetical protein